MLYDTIQVQMRPWANILATTTHFLHSSLELYSNVTAENIDKKYRLSDAI